MNSTALLKFAQNSSGEQPHNINFIVARSLIFIVENYFLQLAPSFVLTLSCREEVFCRFYNDLLEKLFVSWEAPPMKVLNIFPNCVRHMTGSRDLNLILVDSYDTFRAIDVISYTFDYNHNEYYYIFLQNWDEVLDEEMTKIFNYCWENNMINCNVQIQNRQGQILVYTYYPFTPANCGEITVKLINEFVDDALVNNILFPKKLLNFHGCALSAAMWHIPPFVYMTEYANGSGHLQHGIEVRLVKMLAEKLNFSIVVKVPPNHEQRGVVSGGNITGAFRMLRERTVDFAVGSFRFTLDRLQIATATFSYYQSAVILSVPLKAFAFSSLEIILYPFTRTIWLLLSLIWLMVSLLIWLTNKHQRTHPYSPLLFDRLSSSYYLNVLLLALGMPSIVMPSRFSTRLLFMNWIIFTLLLRTTYQALLFHLIRTRPVNRLPTTISDLIAENYTFAMLSSAIHAFKNIQGFMSFTPHFIDGLNETIPFEYIEMNPQKNVVAIGSFDFLVHYVTGFRKDGVFALLKQNIFSMPITMYLGKHSYLLNQFNDELMVFYSNGFIQAWAKWELNYEYLKNRCIVNDVVGLKHLYMVFVLGFLGMLIASVVFLLEILSKKFMFLQKLF